MILIIIETTIMLEIIIDKININQNSSIHTNRRISILEMINLIINKIHMNVVMTTLTEDVMITTTIKITTKNKTTMKNMTMRMIGIMIELKDLLSSREVEGEAGEEVVVEATEAATIKTTTEGINTRLNISKEIMINIPIL